MDVIYLDNNATTRPDQRVVEATVPFLTEWYGNPSSVHRFGQRARQALDEARAQLAGLLDCSDGELTFTSGGTESINTAMRGLLAARAPLRKVVTSAVEHSATRQVCQQLAMEGAQIVEIPVDQDGALDLDKLQAAVDEQTAYVSVMWANNETGILFPVEKIAEICRGKSVPFHCDGTQAVGKIPVSVHSAGIDAMSMAAHKFHGPKGVGALYLRRGVRCRGLMLGGPQEHSRRGGTENVPGVVGMGKAAEVAGECLGDMARVAGLRDDFESRIVKSIADSHIIGPKSPRLPNTTMIGFARLEAEAILLLLSEQGICASAGSACASGSLEPSRVLQAMGIDERIAHGAVRFSLSRFTTPDEIDRAAAALGPVIARVRQVLPVGT